MQYDLFQDDEIEVLHCRVDSNEKSLGNLRRGVFSRLDDFRKKTDQNNSEIQQLKDLLSEMMRVIGYSDVKQIYTPKKAEVVPFFKELIELTK